MTVFPLSGCGLIIRLNEEFLRIMMVRLLLKYILFKLILPCSYIVLRIHCQNPPGTKPTRSGLFFEQLKQWN